MSHRPPVSIYSYHCEYIADAIGIQSVCICGYLVDKGDGYVDRYDSLQEKKWEYLVDKGGYVAGSVNLCEGDGGIYVLGLRVCAPCL